LKYRNKKILIVLDKDFFRLQTNLKRLKNNKELFPAFRYIFFCHIAKQKKDAAAIRTKKLQKKHFQHTNIQSKTKKSLS